MTLITNVQNVTIILCLQTPNTRIKACLYQTYVGQTPPSLYSPPRPGHSVTQSATGGAVVSFLALNEEDLLDR